MSDKVLPERSDEQVADHLRQVSAGTVRLPADATPAMIRGAGGWGRMMDPSVPFVVRNPQMWREVDGVLQLHVACSGLMVRAGDGVMRHQKCATDAWLPIPGGKISIVAVKIAQRWTCESCSAKDDERMARHETGVALTARLRESGIPMALAEEVSWATMLERGATDDETKKRIRAIQVCREWAERESPAHALLLHGDPGTGKTRLAATTAVARLSHSPIVWVSVGVLMAQLDGAWNDEDRRAALKVLTGKGPVVLDDIDKIGEKPGQRVLGHLFTAIDKREQAKQMAVIFTTNKKPSELGGILGDVLMSRITGMCHSNAGLLAFPGPDRRLELGDEGDAALDAWAAP